MASLNKLDKLKEKLKQINDKIDEADERAANAKQSVIESTEQLEAKEEEVESIRRRIQLLQTELENVYKRVEDSEGKLHNVQQVTEESLSVRRQLEENESEGDEKLQKLEEEAKEAWRKVGEEEAILTEAERKHVVLLRDLERTTQKAESFEKRVECLEEVITTAAERMQSLEEREGETYDREELAKEKSVFLQAQVDAEIARSEEAERCVQNLERHLEDTRNERQSWVAKYDEVQQQMEEIGAFAEEDH